MLLLDEPYGELDPPGFALLDRVLDELQRRAASPCCWPRTCSSTAASCCDEAIVLEEGRLVWSGPAADLPGAGSAP